MKFTQRAFSRLLAVTATMAATTLAQAYYVAPYLFRSPGEIIDGYEENGATSKEVHFTDAYRAEVDLRAGTIKNFLQISSPSEVWQSSGSFGDRLTFLNAQGTSLNFSIDIDGNFSGPAPTLSGGAGVQRIYVPTLYVFDASAGATIQNFRTLGGALIAQGGAIFLPSPTDAFDDDVFQSTSGSFVAQSNRVTVDVFATIQVLMTPNGNLGTYTADFSNTSTFDIQTDPGVTYTSESGVLLGSSLTPAVPEPSTYAMLMAGLLSVGFAVRKGSRAST